MKVGKGSVLSPQQKEDLEIIFRGLTIVFDCCEAVGLYDVRSDTNKPIYSYAKSEEGWEILKEFLNVLPAYSSGTIQSISDEDDFGWVDFKPKFKKVGWIEGLYHPSNSRDKKKIAYLIIFVFDSLESAGDAIAGIKNMKRQLIEALYG